MTDSEKERIVKEIFKLFNNLPITDILDILAITQGVIEVNGEFTDAEIKDIHKKYIDRVKITLENYKLNVR